MPGDQCLEYSMHTVVIQNTHHYLAYSDQCLEYSMHTVPSYSEHRTCFCVDIQTPEHGSA